MKEREGLGAKLDPKLREWADRVIIPELVREYLAQATSERIAARPTGVAEFKSDKGLSAEVTR